MIITLVVWVGERYYLPDWVSFGKKDAKLVWTEEERELIIPKDNIWEISSREDKPITRKKGRRPCSIRN